jgi:hypothetical protein
VGARYGRHAAQAERELESRSGAVSGLLSEGTERALFSLLNTPALTISPVIPACLQSVSLAAQDNNTRSFTESAFAASAVMPSFAITYRCCVRAPAGPPW